MFFDSDEDQQRPLSEDNEGGNAVVGEGVTGDKQEPPQSTIDDSKEASAASKKEKSKKKSIKKRSKEKHTYSGEVDHNDSSLSPLQRLMDKMVRQQLGKYKERVKKNKK